MKVVIFAGGVGSRLWPLSRKHTPKQFEKFIGEKSTLQLALERVLPIFKPEDIYISSGVRYKDILFQQLPELPRTNFIFEPEMRDVGAAVGLVSAVMAKIAPDEPLIILWSDHLVKNEKIFQAVLKLVGEVLKKDKKKIVFISQKSRFASQNLGWIETGEKMDDTKDFVHEMTQEISGFKLYEFKSFHYRPDLETAEKFHISESHHWNPGYFGTTPQFLFSLYQKFEPAMYKKLTAIQKAWGTEEYEKELANIYPTLEKKSFDNSILERITSDEGYVVGADLGWSDIGAWESLKEALASEENENVTKGKTLMTDSRDSLIFNYTDQMVVGIDLESFVVINTEDVLLICPKNSVPKIKKVVQSLSGTEHEGLT